MEGRYSGFQYSVLGSYLSAVMAGRRPGHPTGHVTSEWAGPRAWRSTHPVIPAKAGTSVCGANPASRDSRVRGNDSAVSDAEMIVLTPAFPVLSAPYHANLSTHLPTALCSTSSTPRGRDRLTIGRGGQVGAGHVLPRGSGLTPGCNSAWPGTVAA